MKPESYVKFAEKQKHIYNRFYQNLDEKLDIQSDFRESWFILTSFMSYDGV